MLNQEEAGGLHAVKTAGLCGQTTRQARLSDRLTAQTPIRFPDRPPLSLCVSAPLRENIPSGSGFI